MALSRIKKSFSKFKASSTKNKVLVGFIVIGFAGLGIFGVVNSGATAGGPTGNIYIHFEVISTQGQTTPGTPKSGIVVKINSNNASYACTNASGVRGSIVTGTTDAAGNAYFTNCNTPDQPGGGKDAVPKLYNWSITLPSGYTAQAGSGSEASGTSGALYLYPNMQQSY